MVLFFFCRVFWGGGPKTPDKEHKRGSTVSELATHSISSSPAFNYHLSQGFAELAKEDAIALQYMLARLREDCGRIDGLAALPPTVHLPEIDARQHRIVLLNNSPLRTGGTFAFVGFFGR